MDQGSTIGHAFGEFDQGSKIGLILENTIRVRGLLNSLGRFEKTIHPL